MTDRNQIETLLRNAYTARKHGNVDGICDCFVANPAFAMAGAQQASPVAMRAIDAPSFRSVLSGLIKTFEWDDQEILAMIIEGNKAAVHWRGRIRSTVTGDEVTTELVDIITIENGKIATFLEFCDTALAARMMEKRAA
jgi:ketosteroid isomerase-like protein